jgi:hypothetical protein
MEVVPEKQIPVPEKIVPVPERSVSGGYYPNCEKGWGYEH